MSRSILFLLTLAAASLVCLAQRPTSADLSTKGLLSQPGPTFVLVVLVKFCKMVWARESCERGWSAEEGAGE